MSRRKKRLIGKIFRIVSIAFIAGCFIFYGFRLIKYYKKFNPKKTEKNAGLISIAIPKKSSIVTSGDGLYHIGGSYIYKGNVDNNYIMFSGLLFRILKINYGTNVEIVLDNPITSLDWNNELTTYDKTALNNYLNTTFLSYLNKDYLDTTTICLDDKNQLDAAEKKCKNSKDDFYIKNLDINTYLNTLTDTSFINDENDIIWLNDKSNTQVWHINGYNISSSNNTEFYKVLPIVTLNMDVELLGGTGTIDDPYRIDANPDYQIGSYVKLGEDLWRIANSGKELKLILENEIDKILPFGSTSNYDINDLNGTAYYLNNDYYNSLPYKDIIKKVNYNQKNYITNDSKSTECYVSIPSIYDPKFSASENYYYLIDTYDDDMVFIYNGDVTTSKYTISRLIKPVITIDKAVLKNGDGTLENPYRIGE